MFTGHYNGQCDTRFAAKVRFPRNRQTFVDKEEKTDLSVTLFLLSNVKLPLQLGLLLLH